jgi:VanZ family protein
MLIATTGSYISEIAPIKGGGAIPVVGLKIPPNKRRGIFIKWFEKHNKISWIFTIIIALTIFYLSSLSFPQGSPGIEFSLKPVLYHFFAFFFFNAFLMMSITKGKLKNKKLLFLAIIISITYAILDECHQYFVPGRACTLNDIIIDSLGILTASFIYWIVSFRK